MTRFGAVATCVLFVLASRLSAQDAAAEFDQRGAYLAHLAAAEGALRLGESGEVRRFLDAVPPSWRGWEWAWLDASSDESSRSARASEAGLAAVAISPDGAFLAVSGTDRVVRLLDAATLTERKRFEGHENLVYHLAFDPRGERLLSSSQDRSVRLWDVATGECLMRFTKHENPVAAAAFVADGTRVASCSYERLKSAPWFRGVVHVWDASSGEIVETLRGGVKPLTSIAVSPDGARVACGSWDCCVFVWELGGGDAEPVKLEPEPDYDFQINAVAFSPDGREVACGSNDRTARVFDLERRALVATLAGHEGNVNAVAYSSDGRFIATGSDDQRVRFFDARTRELAAAPRGHLSSVRALAFDARGDCVSAGADGSVRVFDPRHAGFGGAKLAVGGSSYAAAFSPDGRRVLTCDHDGSASLFFALDGSRLARFTPHPDATCNTASFSPDGSRIATCSWTGSVALFDADTLEEVARFDHGAGVSYVAFAPDGRRLASTGRDNAVKIFDVVGRDETRTIRVSKSLSHSIAWSPDGTMLACAGQDGVARLVDVASGKVRHALDCAKTSVQSCAFSPDGRFVATASDDGVRLWNSSSGALERFLWRTSSGVHRVVFSPDGTRLAAGSAVVAILDPLHEGPLVKLRPNTTSTWDVRFSPDGSRLAMTKTGGEVLVADTRPVRQRAPEAARARSGRDAAVAWAREALAKNADRAALGRAVREDGSLTPDARRDRLDALLLLANEP